MRGLVFEDSLYSREYPEDYKADERSVLITSQMLNNYLSSEHVKVVFAKSSHNVFEKVLLLRKTFDAVIAYYDLVYDNIDTISGYIRAVKEVMDSGIRNMYIVPIHCIEWHVIKCFGVDCEYKEIAINCSDYTNTKIYEFNMNKDRASHEKYCKAVLGDVVPKRFHSNCLIKDYSITEEEEEILAKSLPVLFTERNGYVDVDITDVLESRYKYFTSLFTCGDFVEKKFIRATSDYLKFLRETSS